MEAPQSFIVTPKHKRYNTGKQMGDVVFETVSGIEDAKDVSKEAIVVAVPLNYNGEIEAGDEVIIHHNIFRSYYNQKGKLTYSKAFLFDDYFQAIPEEVFLYKKDGEWKANEEFCFIKPIFGDAEKLLSQDIEHTGTVYKSNEHPEGMKIGFTPESEYEVWVDDVMYYRMRNVDVCIYYEEE